MSDSRGIENLEPIDERQQMWHDWEAEATRRWDALELILREYDRALSDPVTVMPTRLHFALEAARR